jgi:excisionase family DNA binding protein
VPYRTCMHSPEPQSEQLLTIDEVAALLHVRRQRAYDLVRQGLVPAVRVGRQLRVDRLALRTWIDTGGRALSDGWRHHKSLGTK